MSSNDYYQYICALLFIEQDCPTNAALWDAYTEALAEGY